MPYAVVTPEGAWVECGTKGAAVWAADAGHKNFFNEIGINHRDTEAQHIAFAVPLCLCG
jgi:hypothetical protein